ncbi:GerAB/ArcD/ProY family transporter [Ectobacillus panaciterrae]|uniref:GerAB/ArcD/ProY family transporter n=1 Tax=Ectobacillus panaciterrae TaxID=363872 RepID=UPI00048C074B|nr:endospore germination permease [Ectobacillus panaciterrae]
MIEKGKISAFQMALMMYPTIFSTAILIVPAITGKYAERDMWISPIWGSLNGFLTVFVLYQLHNLYPKKTIIQYSEHVIGRIPGKVLGFAYLFFFLHTNGMILREYTDFIISSFLLKTPMIVVIGSMVLVCAFAVQGGVEVLGRASQLFIPNLIFMLFILTILFLKDLDLKNMFPIMEHGIMPSILGAAAPQSWFSEMFLISMLLPFLTDREKGMKWSMISVLAIMFSMIIFNLIAIFLFGGTTSSYVYPIFSAIRYIQIGNFIQHVESVIIVIWVTGTFIKISVFYYALVLSTAQWLNLSNYRSVVLPLGFLLMLFGMWGYRSIGETSKFTATILPFYTSFVLTLIPTLLLLIAIIRKKMKK